MIDRQSLMRRLDEWGDWLRGGDLHGYLRFQPWARMIPGGEAHQPGYFPPNVQAVERALAQLRLWSRRHRSDHFLAVLERHGFNMPDCALVWQLHRSQWELDALFNSAYWRLSVYLDSDERQAG